MCINYEKLLDELELILEYDDKPDDSEYDESHGRISGSF